MQNPKQLNGQIMMIKTSKTFWLNEINSEKKDKIVATQRVMDILEDEDTAEASIFAMLVYEKNKYLKVIPFLRTKGGEIIEEAIDINK